jgi:hypothetical protein
MDCCGTVSEPATELGARGSVVIDKSFIVMALACAVAPIVGAGVYVLVTFF